MIYKMIVLGDIHWDAFDIDKQVFEIQYPIEIIKNISDLSAVIIAGDYFDTKLNLNGKGARAAVNWLSELVALAKINNFKIRMIKGTNGHDYNQLEIFRGYEKDSDIDFKIITETSKEELFPDFLCLYCPDESMTSDDYNRIYSNLLYPANPYDAVFFHGTFDIVAPNIAVQETESNEIRSVIFRYAEFEKISRVMIGGHWHDAEDQNEEKDLSSPIHMYYTRSFSRWTHGEDRRKGCIFLAYNTDADSYLIHRIENPFADQYETFTFDSSSMKSPEDFQDAMDYIRSVRESHKNLFIRIKFLVMDDKGLNETGLSIFRQKFINDKRIKFLVVDMLRKKKKRDDKKKIKEISSRFSFVRDKGISCAEKIQKYISDTKSKDIPIDEIHSFIDQYLNA